MAIVAIVSGIYCFGDEVAASVADHLGYDLVGEGLLEDVAKKHNTTLKKLSRVFSGSQPLLDGLTHNLDKSLIQIKAAIAELTSGDGVVYSSWAAHLIPRGLTHVLRVALTADRDTRVAIAVEHAGLDAKVAAKAFVHKMALVHIREKPQELLDAMIDEIKKDFDGEVVIGEDLLQILC